MGEEGDTDIIMPLIKQILKFGWFFLAILIVGAVYFAYHLGYNFQHIEKDLEKEEKEMDAEEKQSIP